MAASDDYALSRLAERIEAMSRDVAKITESLPEQETSDDPIVQLNAALRAANAVARVHAENIKALLDIVNMLAGQIDWLRSHDPS